ncbi:MAG: hypothetical protein M3N24_07155, partial [Actinomycetota bacterium]|nr:hypothetical protein [Actinomycetota bacterium]
ASGRGTNAFGSGGSGEAEGLGRTLGVGERMGLAAGVVDGVRASGEDGRGASSAQAAVRADAMTRPATNLIRMTGYL